MRFLTLAGSWASLLFATVILGCSGGGGPGDTGTGGDTGLACGSGMHECDGECVTDQINDPAMGCRRGCGDPCPSPSEGGEAICTSSGLCDVRCEPPFRERGGTCECQPQSCSEAGAQCGAGVDDGCGGTIDCGTCGEGRACTEDNQCGCAIDDAEPNDEELEAFLLGEFPDTPDTMMVFEEYGLDSPDDVDLYRVRVIDASDMSPTIRIELRNIAAASNFDLGAWYRCDAGGDATRCDDGMMATDTSLGPVGCISENDGVNPERVQLQTFCDTTDESGNLIIRVASTEWMNACMPYQLTVRVE